MTQLLDVRASNSCSPKHTNTNPPRRGWLGAGIPSRPPVAAKPLMNIAEFSVNAMKTGILRDAHFLDKYQNDPDVLYARPIVQPGSKVS